MVTPDSPTWYVKVEEAEYGPASLTQLRQWYAEGRITSDSLVRNGKGMWVLASSIPNVAEPRTPPPPPVTATKHAPTTNDPDWLEAIEKKRLVRKPKRPSRFPQLSAFQWVTLGFLGVVATCMLVITLFYVVLPVTIVSGIAKSKGGSEHFRITGPVTYKFGPVNSGFGRIDGGFQFSFPVKNVSSISLDTVGLHIRAKRPSRPMADLETFDAVKIKGGCMPNETVTAYAEAGFDLVQQLRQEPGCVVEVSLDKVKWIKATEFPNAQNPGKQAQSELEGILGQ